MGIAESSLVEAIASQDRRQYALEIALAGGCDALRITEGLSLPNLSRAVVVWFVPALIGQLRAGDARLC